MPRHTTAKVPLTILVVDDECGVREVTSLLLEEEGYRVMQARDGVEALAAIAAQQIDLVLSDISMPRLDGLTLARRLRRTAADLPVVLMSAHPAAADLAGVAVLPKPIAPARLSAAIAGALAARRVRAEGIASSPDRERRA